MSDEPEAEEPAAPDPATLPEAAKRALAEAEERRLQATQPNLPKELGGRGGLEPTRYGDWEKDGIAHDF
ncbi:MAG: DUF1674 domain-containing protein [Pseudomonadota bacterium]